MNIIRLRYFHSVAKLQSFRRAAEVLGVSQPSLSRQIQILEHECVAQLFKRDTKRIVLTPAGVLLMSRVGKLLEELDDLRQSLATLNFENKNRLIVGTIQTTLDYPIPATISILCDRHPNLSVTVRGSKSIEILDGVSRGQLDVGIIATPVADPRVVIEPIIRESYFAVLPKSHFLAEQKQIRLADLKLERLISFPRNFLIRDMIELAFTDEKIDLTISAEIDSIEAIKSMVRTGSFASILPRSALLGSVSVIGLSFIPIDSKRLVREILAARLETTKDNPLINQFVDVLKHVYRDTNVGFLNGTH